MNLDYINVNHVNGDGGVSDSEREWKREHVIWWGECEVNHVNYSN